MLKHLAKWLLPPAIRWLDDSVPETELEQFLNANLERVISAANWQTAEDQSLVSRLRDQFGGPVPLASIPDPAAEQATLAAALTWLHTTCSRNVLERGVLLVGSADQLRVLMNAELDPNARGWLDDQLERLLRHVETRRQEALQQFSPLLDKTAACLERLAVTRLFLLVTRLRGDLRFLNAALKLNDWALKVHRRLAADDPRLLRYVGNLVEQQALLSALEA